MVNNESFGNYLLREYHRWAGKQIGKMRGMPSQAEFAKYLNIPTTSLSQWINDLRVPQSENVDKLADKLGVEVYDRLGLARKMPRDKKLYFIATVWRHLPENMQDEWYEKARNVADKEKGGGGDPAFD